MEAPKNNDPLPFGIPRELPENRRHGRIRCDHVTCSFGKVRDLSASGMKVLRKTELTQTDEPTEITFTFNDDTLVVRGKLVRSTKLGFRKYLYGFEFVDLTEDQRRGLTEMARVGMGQLLLVEDDEDE